MSRRRFEQPHVTYAMDMIAVHRFFICVSNKYHEDNHRPQGKLIAWNGEWKNAIWFDPFSLRNYFIFNGRVKRTAQILFNK
jgi:hypothetical protein